MKGRTTCPQCKSDFIVDVPDDVEKHEIICKTCNNKFIINCSPIEEVTPDGDWEEHGEPRKTILSSLKTKTNKPIFASFLLLAVGVLGIFNAVFEVNKQEVIPYFTTLFSILTNEQIAVLVILFSIGAIIGCVTTIKRVYFHISVIGAILGIFSFGFFVGFIISVAALVLIMLSRDEFENGTKGKVF